ncbi:MAG: VPLPA-CTERM sorting domain-containing protein [Gammaproteobacteria bacterium]
MKLKTILGAVALMGTMASANAASLSLIYTGGATGGSDGSVVNVAANDVITFDLMMDFSGPGETTLGGGYDVIWDANLFGDVVWTSGELGEEDLRRDPDRVGDSLYNGGFAAFNGLSGPDLVGSISFTVIGTVMPGKYNLSPSGTTGTAGPFVSEVDNVTILNPDFNGVVVRVVPVPAAVWFMLSGLGALIGFGRRSRV